METRKVQRVGYSTLAVSLPKDWANDVGLRRGDIITFKREENRALTIFPGIEPEEKEILISTINADLCNEPDVLTRIITGSYVLGCDTVQVTSEKELKQTHLEEIHNTTRRLTGINIVEQTADQVTIQSFLDPNKFPVEGLIRRLHIIASSMQITATRSLFENKPELTKEVLRMEEEADRIYWLILRQLILTQRDIEKPRRDIVGNRVIAKHIEAIADYAQNIASGVMQIKDTNYSSYSEVLEELSKLNEMVQAISNKTAEALIKRNIKLANDVIETTKLVVEKERILTGDIITKVTDVNIATTLRSIIWSLRQISRYSKEIAEITINRSLATPNELCEIEKKTENID